MEYGVYLNAGRVLQIYLIPLTHSFFYAGDVQLDIICILHILHRGEYVRPYASTNFVHT
jgi:hypothetical protein